MTSLLESLPAELHLIIVQYIIADNENATRDMNAYNRTCHEIERIFGDSEYVRNFKKNPQDLVLYFVKKSPIKTFKKLLSLGKKGQDKGLGLIPNDIDRPEDGKPLSESIAHGRLDIVQALMEHWEHHCDKGEKFDVDWQQPLYRAVWHPDIQMLQAILGAIKRKSTGPEYRHLVERMVLMPAIVQGKLDVATYCLAEGADVNAQVPQSYGTPLACAIYFARIPLIELFLANGASKAHVTLLDDIAPLDLAAGLDDIELAHLLIHHGILGNPIKGVWRAACYGNETMTSLLLDNGGNPDGPGLTGISPMIIAAHGGFHGVVEILLERGAQADYGLALTMAATNGHLRVVEVILDKVGAVVASSDIRHAASNATEGGHARLLEMILDRDRDLKSGIDLQDLLRSAIMSQQPNTVTALLKKGARPYCRERCGSGTTPLHRAMWLANSGLVSAIISHRGPKNDTCLYSDEPDWVRPSCDCSRGLDAADDYGRTALYLAARWGLYSCVLMLLQKGSRSLDKEISADRSARSHLTNHKRRLSRDPRAQLLPAVWRLIDRPSQQGSTVPIIDHDPDPWQAFTPHEDRCGNCGLCLSRLEIYHQCRQCADRVLVCGDCIAQGHSCPEDLSHTVRPMRPQI